MILVTFKILNQFHLNLAIICLANEDYYPKSNEMNRPKNKNQCNYDQNLSNGAEVINLICRPNEEKYIGHIMSIFCVTLYTIRSNKMLYTKFPIESNIIYRIELSLS